MKQKYIAFLLILTTFLSSISFVIHTDQPTYAYDVIQIANYIRAHYLYDEEGARSYVEDVVGSKNYRTRDDRVVNIAILRDFNKLVYTYPKYDYYGYKGQGDYQKDEKGEWHYRDLGYLYNDDTKVTNPHFPNTAGTTPFFSTYRSKNWIKTNGAVDSWIVDDSLAKHMLTYKKIYAQDGGGYVPGSINIKDDVLGGKSVDEAMNYAIYQTPSTLKMTGSVRLYHMLSSGSTYYRTLDVAPVPFSLPQLKVTVEKPLYEFGQEEMTKNVKVTAEVYFDDFAKLDDWKIENYIDRALIEVNGQEQEVYFEKGKLKADFIFEENRTNFKSGAIDTVTYKSRAKVVAQELFKDEFTCYGETSTNFLVNAGEVEPYFVIKNNGVDVTDDVIEYKDWQDVNLTLEPNNRVSKPNEITGVLWKMQPHPKESGLSEIRTGNKTVNYTMTQPKLSTHADKDGKVTFTMLIKTLYKFDYGGLKGIDEYIVPHTVTFKKIDEDDPDPTLPQPKEPVAKLRAPSKVRMGDRFTLSGTGSYDPDGEIIDYDFKLQAIREIEWLNDEKSRVKATVMSTSDNDIKLVVTDDDGLEGSTSDDIEILPPIEARLRVDGLRKVNRKVTLNASESIDAYYFPIDNYSWTITPLDGQSNTVNYGTSDTANINYETNNKGERANVLIKEPGAYEITLNIHAQCTLEDDEEYEASDSVSYPIMIQSDLKPTAELTVISLALRDKMDDLNASIEMLDTSYSEDGDQTRTKQWYVRHDSDNDGDRTDETWTPIGTGKVHELYKTKKLGDYDFYHEVVEVIPEEDTIQKFLTESDYLTDNSLNQVYQERYCHVDNVAPVISTTAELEKEIDLLVITDEDGENYTNLLAEVNKLTKEMYERKIGVNHEIINSSNAQEKVVGLKKEQTFKWYRNWGINFKWAFTRNFDYGDKDNITKPFNRYLKSGTLETKNGTIDEMLDWQTYPNAYGVFNKPPYISYYETPSGRDTWQVTRLNVDIYDDLYDYRGLFNFPYSGYGGKKGVGVADVDSSRDFYYRSNISSIDRVTYWSEIENQDNFPYIFMPDMDIVVDKNWVQGELLNETDESFSVYDIENIIDSYKESSNDKYLIYSMKDGSKIYTPNSLRNKLEEYGFKIYFSVDEFWGEFKPKPMESVDLKLEDNTLYAQTKFGNHMINHNDTRVENLYYKYKRKESENIDYSNNINDFKRLSPITNAETSIYKSRIKRKSRFLVGRMAIQTHWSDSDINLGMHEDMYKYHDDRYFHKRNNGTPHGTLMDSISYPVPGEWVMDDEEVINVSKVYSNSNYSKIVEDVNGDVYYIGNDISYHDSNDDTYITAKRIDLGVIENVYGLNISDTYIANRSQLYFFRDTIYIIKDINGNFALCRIKPNNSSEILKMEIYYFDDIEKFSYSQSSSIYKNLLSNNLNYSAISKVHIEGSGLIEDSGVYHNVYSARYTFERYRYAYKDYSSSRKKWTSFMPGYFTEEDYREQTYPYFTFMLVDKSGDLFIDGVKQNIGSKAEKVELTAGNDWIYAYVDTDGEVWGKGMGGFGQLGSFDYQSNFVKVFNTPYVLKSSENTKDFDSVYDITSESPQYKSFSRGHYSEIMNSIISEYEDYGETETVFIQVGDTIDIGGFVLDYEGDSIYEKRIDVTHDNTYFDNADTAWVPPADFDGPVTVDVPGRMEIRLRAQDNPVGNDERFAEYRYWNKDNTSIEVIAHRPPIAKLGYALVPQGDGTFNFSGTDNGSYDLDHSQSRTDKGIADRQFYYRKELDPTWTAFNGTLPIENGVKYQFALRVKDIENAWSDYDIVDIKINGEPFVLNASTDPAYPVGVPAGDSVFIKASVFTHKALDKVQAIISDPETGTVVSRINLNQVSVNGMERTYENTYKLPTGLKDKDHYSIIVRAIPSDGSPSKEVPLKLNVLTPINLTGQINPYTIKKGQTGAITATTTKYASQCRVDLFSNTGTPVSMTLQAHGQDSHGNKKWKGQYTFVENHPEGQYEARFIAQTANGNREETLDTFEFIPNQAPTVTYLSKTPNFIYEGDDVSLTFRLSDPDGDPLDVLFEYAKHTGESGGQRNWQVLYSESGVSLTQGSGGGSKDYTVDLNHVEKASYSIRATVTDPLGESGQTQTSISAEELSVSGQVHHVDKWNENRMAYNTSKSGTDNSPRPYDMFWSGEQFNLEAVTTALSDGSTTTCDSVSVEILNKSQSTVLNQGTNAYTWQGDLWDSVMMDWPDGVITFRFTARFSNGIKKTYDVDVILDNSESYWQIHRLF